MNHDLLKNNYLIIPNFIHKKHAETIKNEFELTNRVLKFHGDPQAPNSSSVYNYLPALELLTNKASHVSEIVGETVFPTYTYARIYRNGSVLTKHTDRPSCEVSVTLHLGGDIPWAIWIETPKGEKRCVSLNPGDAMIYLGCIAPHWRNKFEGDKYTQFFLHYVRSRGCCAEYYFDNDNDKNEELLNNLLKLEYDNMARLILPNGCEDDPKFGVVIGNRTTDKYDIETGEEKNTIEYEYKSKKNKPQIKKESSEFVDFDDTIIINEKYIDKLSKKNSVDFIAKPKLDKKNQTSKSLSTKPLSDFVWHKKEFIDLNLCNELIEEYGSSNYWQPTLTGGGHDPNARKCNVICISEPQIIQDQNAELRQELDSALFDTVHDAIQEYQSLHKEFELEIQEDTGYELLKYEVGDYYIQHSDSFKDQPRALTVIISINDNYEGGEVALFNRELKYKLNAGDILIFPSNFMYPHEITPVTKGIRYSLITWVV